MIIKKKRNIKTHLITWQVQGAFWLALQEPHDDQKQTYLSIEELLPSYAS